MQNETKKLSIRIKIAILIVVVLWASAFVGIRIGLQGYSPGSLALLRFLVASICMLFVYLKRIKRPPIQGQDLYIVLIAGFVGIGFYHIALNFGEIVVPAGIASFVISQSPVITAILAVLFLRERINLVGLLGMIISVVGVILIATGQTSAFSFYLSILYVLGATLTGSIYAILQKPLLKKYHAIDLTTYAIWAGTLLLLIFLPNLAHDIQQAPFKVTMAVIYLGIFPGAIAYLAWSYVLNAVPASRAASFLYFLPPIATLIGWTWLGEVPAFLTLVGGLIALLGVWVVNQSYSIKLIKTPILGDENA